MIESFEYKIWFDIKPINTSNGELKMKHGELYEVEGMKVTNGPGSVYKIRGRFNGCDYGRRSYIIVSERIYKLIEAYANEPEFIKIR
jgi:hypothetical protein